MTISGWVVTLTDDPGQQERALSALRGDGRLQLGERAGRKVPVVAETRTTREGEELLEALGGFPGVAFVDVVCVDFSGDSTPAGA